MDKSNNVPMQAQKNTVLAEKGKDGYNNAIDEREGLIHEQRTEDNTGIRGRSEIYNSEKSTAKSARNGGIYEGTGEETGVGVYEGRSGTDVYLKDSEGREVDEQNSARIKDTVVKNENGEPIAAYHFTPEMEFETFERGDLGFHFGNKEQAKNRMVDKETKTGRMFRAYLNMKNPIRFRIDINAWWASHSGLYLFSEGYLTASEWDEIKSLRGGEYNAPAEVRLREILESKGYDGIIYPNGVEVDGYSYMVFHDDQIIKTEISNVEKNEGNVIINKKDDASFKSKSETNESPLGETSSYEPSQQTRDVQAPLWNVKNASADDDFTNSIPQPMPVVNTGNEVLDRVVREVIESGTVTKENVSDALVDMGALMGLSTQAGLNLVGIEGYTEQRRAVEQAIVRLAELYGGRRTRTETTHQSGTSRTPSPTDGGSLGDAAIAEGTEDGYNNDITETESALDREEQWAIRAYKTGDSYKINGRLLGGMELDEYFTILRDGMDSALPKLPIYQGTVYRTLGFDDFGGKEAMDEFIAQHQVGESICYGAYSSCSRVPDGHTIDGEHVVTLIIESKTGRDFEGVGDNGEQEVLFERFTDFLITKIDVDRDGHTVIYLSEVTDNGNIQQRTVVGHTGRNKKESKGLSVETSETEMQQVREKDTEHRESDVQEVSERYTETNQNKRAGVSGLSTERGANHEIDTDIDHARADIQPDSPAQRWDAERIKNTERDEDKPPLSLSELVAKIKHDFGINITVGHVRGKGVRGQYNRNDKGVRTKVANNLPTIAHELGHHIDNVFSLRQTIPADTCTNQSGFCVKL